MENFDERYNEKANNILGALSYLSVFCTGVISTYRLDCS